MFKKTLTAEEIGICGVPKDYLQKLIFSVHNGAIPKTELDMGNGKRISITKARKEPMIISVSSAMNEEQYKGCFKLLPDSIKDFNKYEFSRGTRVRCNVYVLGDGDFACVRSSDKLVGEYEEVQSKAISLPTELEDKCDYLSRYYCFCDCKKEIETIKSLKEFFEGRSDKDDRIIVDAFNYELQEAIQRCRGEYPKTSITRPFTWTFNQSKTVLRLWRLQVAFIQIQGTSLAHGMEEIQTALEQLMVLKLT
jgi:hypothetical protein